MAGPPRSAAERQRAMAARRRSAGLVPVKLWVPAIWAAVLRRTAGEIRRADETARPKVDRDLVAQLQERLDAEARELLQATAGFLETAPAAERRRFRRRLLLSLDALRSSRAR
ncbi:hypothetical protein [Tistlia consotensis]|uniref:hypothetical protein n=1 Tax=Tistlia consotensis TaxID=1321365 RepID=UPI00117C2BDF|nr:hypothetical protein [Tistlia consotensis]